MTQASDTRPAASSAELNRQPDSSRSAARIALILATYLALATGAIYAARAGGALLLATMPLVLGCSFILSGFLNAAHDCVHATQFDRRVHNRVAGALWCTPILIVFTIYQRQHMVHHRYTGVPGDSEGHANYSNLTDYCLNQAGLNYWRALVQRLGLSLRGQFPDSVRSPRQQGAARLECAAIMTWLGLCFVLTWLWPLELMFGYWLGLLVYPAFAMLFGLPEHYGLALSGQPWPKARNVRSNVLVRFFQWNANYHAFHHRHPAVPGTKLAAAPCTADFAADPCEPGYLRFHRRVIANIGALQPPHIKG